MQTNFRRALGFGVIGLVASAGVTAFFVQEIAVEGLGRDVVGRIVGACVMGVALLLIVETPVLFALHWAVRRCIRVPPLAWALVAAILAMAPVIAFNMPGEPLSVKISETVQTFWSQPRIAVPAWLPFIIAGAVFGWYLFLPRGESTSAAG